jgi:tetratricopeptide (TPR) repeat protein
MACLDQRLEQMRALAGILAKADGPALDKAVDAVGALPSLSRCASVTALVARDALPDSPEVRAEVQRLSAKLAEARALEDSGRYKQGLEAVRPLVEAAEKLAYRPLRAEVLLAHGSLQMKLGDFKGAEQSLSEAVWIAEASRHDEVTVLAATKLIHGTVNFSQGRFGEANLWSRLAGAALERMGGSEDLEMNLLAARATIVCRSSTCAGAKELMERAIALADRVLGPDDVKRSLFLSILATSYQDRGELPQARLMMEESLALAERLRGKHHPANGYTYVILAGLLLDLGEPAEALTYAQRGRETMEAGLGPNAPTVAGACEVEGRALLGLGRPTEALAKFQRALASKEKALGAKAPSVAVSLNGVAHAYLELNRPQDALPLLERALAMHIPEQAYDAEVRFNLARALVHGNRDRARARALANEARARFEKLGQHREVSRVDSFLAAIPR